MLKNYFAEFHIIALVETFIEEKNVARIEALLPKGYTWIWTHANRDKTRGRPWGGQLIGITNKIQLIEKWEDRERCCNGIEIKVNEDTYCLTNVYNQKGIQHIKPIIVERLERNMNKKCIIVGDWNARIGNLGSSDAENDDGRPSKDTEVNAEGRSLIELFEDIGLNILNGNKQGDWQGQITHVGYRSQSVIDYGATNQQAWEDITKFEIGNQQLSDHFPLEITLKTPSHKLELETEKYRWIHCFNAEERANFTNQLRMNTKDCTSWSQLAEAIRNTTKKRRTRNKASQNRWWNANCYEARKKVELAHRKAKEEGDYSEYHEVRRAYKQIIRESKEAEVQKTIDELKGIKNLAEAWKYINRTRKVRFGPTNAPTDQDILNHFTQLLQGKPMEHSVATNPRTVTVNYDEISEDELEEHIKKLKLGKAAGLDDIKAEAIIYADETTKDKIRVIMNNCLAGRPIPEEWRDVMIYPLHKKGDPSKAENYRGISIVNSVYKLYASIINKRLEKFVENNNVLPDCQNGFRKGRSTIDNLYILNTCIQKTIAKGQHLYTVFIDFKAAFDTINREKLLAKMKKLNIPTYIILAIEEIYRSTPYTCSSHTFLTTTGLRQGCPLSPLLFAIYISDLELVLRNWQSGGVRIGQTVVRSLAYADDLVLMAHTPGELRDMLGCLRRYADSRDLIISCEKSKVMRFGLGGRKSTQRWPCGESYLEEVDSFKYLGFVFQCSGKYTKHVSALASVGKKQTSSVWSLAEHKFPNNFIVRKQMYTSLVESTMMYGAELFGLQEYPEIEAVQRRYIRWTLGVAPWTKIGSLYDEAKCTPVHTRTCKRALRYEFKAQTSPCILLRECVRENRGTVWIGNEKPNLIFLMRKKFIEEMGFSIEEIDLLVEQGTDVTELLTERRRQKFLEWQGAEMNQEGDIRPRCLAGYLLTGREIKMVARFRLRNEDWASQRWRAEKRCRVCGIEEETLTHVLECSGAGGSEHQLLDESGGGISMMKSILEWRRRAQN